MNSFSPNKSVSNSKTVVRFAVDLFFSAASLAIVLLVSLPAFTNPATYQQPKNPTETVLETCEKHGKDSWQCRMAQTLSAGGRPDYRTRQCDEYVKKIGEMQNAAKKACSAASLGQSDNFNRCYDQIKWCAHAQQQVEELVAEEEMTENQVCDTVMANQCPGLPEFMEGRNFREEEKDAERERLEAKRAVDELTRERRDAQRDMLKQQRELQEAQQDAAYEVRKAEREIAKDMSNQFKEIQEGQKKAFDDAQRAYQEMDATYIKMRDESRQYALKVEEAKDKFHGQCIAQAESQFKAAEQARLAAKSKKKKNAGSATRLAGSRNRQNLNQTAKRNFDYNAYLNECLNGQTGVGKSLANAVRAAEREKATRDQSLKEQAALIEQQRQSMLKKLMELESVAEGQNAEIVKLTNERLQNLSEEQQRIAAKNQARLREFMQDQQLRLSDIDQRLQTESQQLTKYEQEAMVANRRAICAGKASRKSESSLERLAEGWNSAIAEIDGLVDQCVMYEKLCNPEGSTTSTAGQVRAVASATTEEDKPKYYKLPECNKALETRSGSDKRLDKRGRWSPDRTTR